MQNNLVWIKTVIKFFNNNYQKLSLNIENVGIESLEIWLKNGQILDINSQKLSKNNQFHDTDYWG